MTNNPLTDCRILIVDDTETNVLLLKGILQGAGYNNLREVLDSRKTLQECAGFRPDLILLDLMMPHLDGFAVMGQLQSLLAIQPYLPILVLTADASAETKRRALASGANDFLAKPLDAVEELLRDRNLLETRLLYLRQRQQADERIKEQAAMLDRAGDAIFVMDMRGEITYWNRGAEAVLGWSLEEAIGCDIPTLFGSDVQPQLEEAKRTSQETGQWSGELRAADKAGRMRSLMSRWTLVRDAGGRPKSVLVICTDVTEKKELEAQLLRVQRLESIGLLAGGIAHDLNNVLAPILMAVDLLKLNRSVPSSMLATLRSSAQRGTELVRQVLTFARGGDDDPARPLLLRHLVEEVVQMARHSFPRSLHIGADVPRDVWLVKGDATQLHQVLMNLCVNARDAMPEGGDLTLSCRNGLASEEQGPNAVTERYVIVQVRDTGMGIAKDIADRIFEPFFTTKEAGKGTGLGLALVRTVVKRHGGFVRFASEVGKGSTFEVYLPALSSMEAPPAPPVPQAWPGGQGELILVVEDEAGLRRMVAMMLEATGYRVVTAQHGAEALTLFGQHRDRIAAVLTDMTMPHMDGATLVRALRELAPRVRIITASGVEASVPDACAHLHKPYSAERLLTAVRQALSTG